MLVAMPRTAVAQPHFAAYELSLLLGSAIYLYLNLFTLTGTPFLLGGDQVFYWTYALRLLHGEGIYQDFFQITPPGTDLVYLGAFQLFGPHIWVPNLVVLVVGISLCWLCFRVARSIMRPGQAALAAALFTIFFYGKMLNGTHHAFSMLAVMAALAVVVEGNTATRFAFAGVFLGAASFFTQTAGAFVALGIAAYLIRDGFRKGTAASMWLKPQALLWLPLGLTWLALSGYFIATAGLRQLLYFQITHVRHYMVSGHDGLSLGFSEALTWIGQPSGAEHLLVYAALPCVYAYSLWKCRGGSGPREPEPAEAGRIVPLAMAGVATFVEVAQHPSWLRVYYTLIPGVILFVWILAQRIGRWQKYAVPLLAMGLLGIASYQTWFRHRAQFELADLPAGRIATTPLNAERLTWLARHTTPGQFFFQAGWPGVYLPLGLRNPVFLDELDTSYQIPPDYIQLSIQQLEAKRVQYVLWTPRLESPAYPFAPVHELLVKRYHRVWTFSDGDEVWQRQ